MELPTSTMEYRVSNAFLAVIDVELALWPTSPLVQVNPDAWVHNETSYQHMILIAEQRSLG